jgi:hypothetical protein
VDSLCYKLPFFNSVIIWLPAVVLTIAGLPTVVKTTAGLPAEAEGEGWWAPRKAHLIRHEACPFLIGILRHFHLSRGAKRFFVRLRLKLQDFGGQPSLDCGLPAEALAKAGGRLVKLI